MGNRLKPIDTPEAGIADIYDQLRTIKTSLQDRLLPPGYVINEAAGALVITKQSDGTTATLSFT